ncbi:MAG: hypothetical protein H3C38_14490 [Rhodospirillales bacterium]|nr:hypothetical protein [Rhodospirillales bacterium]
MSDRDDYATNALPRRLDDIVRRQRDRCQIRLASAAEFDALHTALPAARARHTLADWRLIAIVADGNASLHLLGTTERTESWITSRVSGLDLETRSARTANNHYALAAAGAGEPPFEHVLHVCAALNAWGLGRALDVVRVFY